MSKGIKRGLLLLSLGGALLAAVGYWLVLWTNTQSFDDERSVYIPRDSSFDAALDSLESAGIVNNRATLSFVATATGWGNQVKAGHYQFVEGGSNKDILSKLRRGLQKPVKVVIPPGSRKEVVAAVVAKHMEFDADDFLAALSNEALAEELGTDTTHLFGFMLPDTYNFYWLTDAESVVEKVKGYFDAYYDKNYAGNPLGIGLASEDVVNVASIVEWETSVVDEKPTVAGVYLNRLRDGWRLDADPTVQFIIMKSEGQKRRLFFKDYKLDHPYNTYRFKGLPPGPVTNPSRTSIEAVLKPLKHDYYYFVAVGDGRHDFSRTLSEHNRAAQRFYRVMRERRARRASTGG